MSATSLKSFKTAFDGRLKDVHLCLDAVKGPNAQDQLRNALVQLNELRQLTKDYELEVPKDPEARSVLRECNKTINSVKNAYAEKEAFVQRQTEREVLGEEGDEDLDEETGAGKVAQHNRMLNESRKHLGRAIDYAGSTSVELERQKEKLQKARQTSEHITGDLGVSAALVGALQRIRNKNRLVYFAVLGFVCFFLFYIVILKRLM